MCGCIDRTNKRFVEKGMNTKLSLALFLDGKVRILVATQKANSEIRGKPMDVMATFCPFCGEKYPELIPETISGGEEHGKVE